MDVEFVRKGAWLEADTTIGKVTIIDGSIDAPGPWDIELVTNDGRRLLGVAATFTQLATIMERWQSTGECLSGGYLWIAGLVIVDRLEAHRIAEILFDLVHSGELEAALTVASSDHGDEGEAREPN